MERPWWRTAGGVLLLYLAVGFAAIEGVDVTKTYQNSAEVQQNQIAIEGNATTIHQNGGSISENRDELEQIKEQLARLSTGLPDELSVRSPGCLCIKPANEGQQVRLVCPTKGPVCDSTNRRRCEEQNPGFEC